MIPPITLRIRKESSKNNEWMNEWKWRVHSPCRRSRTTACEYPCTFDKCVTLLRGQYPTGHHPSHIAAKIAVLLLHPEKVERNHKHNYQPLYQRPTTTTAFTDDAASLRASTSQPINRETPPPTQVDSTASTNRLCLNDQYSQSLLSHDKALSLLLCVFVPMQGNCPSQAGAGLCSKATDLWFLTSSKHQNWGKRSNLSSILRGPWEKREQGQWMKISR